jgi:hypothetical protein
MKRPDIDAIRKRADWTIRGKWSAGMEFVFGPLGTVIAKVADDGTRDFIAAARTDIPALLDYIAELEAKIGEG